MLNKNLTTLLAASVMMASTPALAETTAASVQPRTEAASGSAQFDDRGTETYVLAAIVGGLLIWGFVELIDDEDELEISPN